MGVDGPKTATTGTSATRQKNPPPSARKQVERQANANAESALTRPRDVVNNVPNEPIEMYQDKQGGGGREGASGSPRRQRETEPMGLRTPSRLRKAAASSGNLSPEKPQRAQVVTKQVVAQKPAPRQTVPNKAMKTRSGVAATTSVKKAMPVKKATPVTRAQKVIVKHLHPMSPIDLLTFLSRKATTTAAAAASTPALVAPKSSLPLHPPEAPTLSPVPQVDSPLPTPAKPKSRPATYAQTPPPPRKYNLAPGFVIPPGILDQTGSFWSSGRRLSRRSLGNFTPLAAPPTVRRRFSAGHENSLGKKPSQPKPSTKRKSTDLSSSVQEKGKEQEQSPAKKVKIASPEVAKTSTKATRQSSKVAAKQEVVQETMNSVFYFSDDE